MLQDCGPDVAGLVAGCHRIAGRMAQEYSASVKDFLPGSTVMPEKVFTPQPEKANTEKYGKHGELKPPARSLRAIRTQL
jgi:hypothetical protein